MLEAHDLPRGRLLEAESLVAQFEEILSGDSEKLISRHDSTCSNASERAQNILKLHLAASELMSSRYNEAKQKIAKEYSRVCMAAHSLRIQVVNTWPILKLVMNHR